MEDASAAAFIPLCGLGGKHRVLGRSKKARESRETTRIFTETAQNLNFLFSNPLNWIRLSLSGGLDAKD